MFDDPGACLLRNVDAYRMLHKAQAPLMTSVQGIYDSTARAHYCRLLLLRTPCLQGTLLNAAADKTAQARLLTYMLACCSCASCR